jgi:hypothetical protein
MNKSITHFFGESDSAIALAGKLDPLINHLWFIGKSARAYAFQLNKPDRITIGLDPAGQAKLGPDEVVAVYGVHDVDGTPVEVIGYDPAAEITEALYAGAGIAVRLTTGGLLIAPEFWSLPPQTKIRPGEDNPEFVAELEAFTAEMRHRELEMETAKRHFEKLQADEEARIAAEAAVAEVSGDPEAIEVDVTAVEEQLELELSEKQV